MKKRDLILIGGGGHCKAVIDVAECAGYNILGVIDPFMEKGENVLGYPILGGDDEIEEYIHQASFVIATLFNITVLLPTNTLLPIQQLPFTIAPVEIWQLSPITTSCSIFAHVLTITLLPITLLALTQTLCIIIVPSPKVA